METRPHRTRRDNRSLNRDLSITKRRLALLSILNDFEPLDTAMLHALVEAECGATHYGRFQNGMTAMRKVGGYVHCPPAQFETFNSDYKRLVYQLTDRGRRVLQDHGISTHNYHTQSLSFAHDWMTAHAIASLKLETQKAPNVRFMMPEEILSRAPARSEKHPFKFPVTIDWQNQRLEIRNFSPDFAVFGLEYERGGEKAHNFFLWETDCHTEPVETDLERSSIVKKILAYRELDKPDHSRDNQFYKRLKITNNYVCIVTTNNNHKRAIMEAAKRICGKSEIFLFRVIPHFRRLDYSPPPLAELWHDGWDRVGFPQFFFNQPQEG